MIEVFKDGVKINSGTAIDLNESSGIDIAGTGDGHKADFTISLEDSATEVATASHTSSINYRFYDYRLNK